MEQVPTDSSQDRSYDPAEEVVQLCQDLIGIDTSNYGTDDGPGERKAAEHVAALLDEASAAAEAMTLIRRSTGHAAQAFFVDAACHPQVIAVMRTRAKWLGIQLVVGDAYRELDASAVFGVHLQYPDTFGRLRDPRPVIESMHAAKGLVSVGCDPLALGSLSEHTHSPITRIDFVQHAWAALGYESVDFDG